MSIFNPVPYFPGHFIDRVGNVFFRIDELKVIWYLANNHGECSFVDGFRTCPSFMESWNKSSAGLGGLILSRLRFDSGLLTNSINKEDEDYGAKYFRHRIDRM